MISPNNNICSKRVTRSGSMASKSKQVAKSSDEPTLSDIMLQMQLNATKHDNTLSKVSDQLSAMNDKLGMVEERIASLEFSSCQLHSDVSRINTELELSRLDVKQNETSINQMNDNDRL